MTDIIHRHFKIYKPSGMLSQFVSQQKKAHKKKFLGALHDFPTGTMAVGRLDEKSEGLLLLTTDGAVSFSINNGPYEKEYWAQVAGVISSEAITQLENGVTIGIHGTTYRTKQCVATKLDSPTLPDAQHKLPDDRHGPTSWVRIVLTERKFRQVRKMTAAVGYPTLRLVRVRIGDQLLDGLRPGDVVPIEKPV